MTVSCHTHKNIRNCEKGPHTKERKMRIGDKRHTHTQEEERKKDENWWKKAHIHTQEERKENGEEGLHKRKIRNGECLKKMRKFNSIQIWEDTCGWTL